MAKRHVENTSVHSVGLVPWAPGGFPPGAAVQPLSADPATGALTAVLTLPPAFDSATPLCTDVETQLFVLEGTLRMGAYELNGGGYCYHPAGSPHGRWSTATGVRLIAIFSGSPTFSVADPSLRDPGAILALDSWALQWIDPLAASDPSVEYRTGVMVKLLRTDELTGSSTHLAGLMPGWFMPGLEVHPVYEENYCLSGDVHIGRVGDAPGYTMTEGVYLCRPPGIPHGPILSKNGNVNFCYTHGRLGIDYQEAPDSMDLIRRHLTNHPWR